ncbi:hypothetical protein C8R45DRAFT_1052932 [Mycena sanguinolenta]|nr:hypothetical protein C8R45DRAFT_1052932 [Mycena sanguinolenta]
MVLPNTTGSGNSEDPSRRRCTCQRYCKGGANVARATWYDHAPERAANAQEDLSDTESSTDAKSSSEHSVEMEANTAAVEDRAIDDLALEERPRKKRRIEVEEEEDYDDDSLDLDHFDIENVKLEDLKIALELISAVENASLDNGDLNAETVHRLRNPIAASLDISDPSLRFALDIFIATSNASEETYDAVRAATLTRYPNDSVLTHYQVKKQVAELSGVVPMLHDMCPNVCMAYTGPYADRTHCKFCGAARYEDNMSPRRFYTIPLGPQLQALFRSPESVEDMKYRAVLTAKIQDMLEVSDGIIETYEDVFHGKEYLDAVQRGDITNNDIVVIGSTDGAQLYRNKSSFFFPTVHHLSALQREGLRIWNCETNEVFTSRPFLLLETADGPGLTYLNGLVGHHGAYGCRLYCALKGRHKEGAPTYYPAMNKPNNYNVEGCSHDDVDPRSIAGASESEYQQNLAYVLDSPNPTEYKVRRKQTGISKPSILSGLPRPRSLGIPGSFGPDLMHWACLNWTELMYLLLTGKMECEDPDKKDNWDFAALKGDIWKTLGQAVADATPYLPGSFDRAPRNPAEKISSGYKAWEWQMFMIAMGPTLLYGKVPEKYWLHFCRGVSVIRSANQRKIPREQLVSAHKNAISYVSEFEDLYYQRKPERLHFVRQSVHAMTHLAPETIRLGLLPYFAQWPIERTIGNLGEEIKQHSNPYANLSERGVRRSQVNALKAMFPQLDTHSAKEEKLPEQAKDLGDGFALLRARDEYPHTIDGARAAAIRAYLDAEDATGEVRLKRWARARLPNGQIARSAWKEKQKPLRNVRMARNVWVRGQLEVAEVHFFFRHKNGSALALASLYSQPDEQLLRRSYNTVWSCTAPLGFTVIKVKSIESVVAMVPHRIFNVDRFFLVEKPGLDMMNVTGQNEPDDGQ